MIKLKKITPLFTQLLLTADVYEEDQVVDGLIDTTKSVGTMKEIQKVLAVGSAVSKEITVGKYVAFNPSMYAKKMHKEGSLKDGIITDNPVMYYDFPIIEVDGKPCLLVDNRSIDFVIDDYEEVDNTDTNVLVS